jgi:selenocysteine lyase/cysteine desulfurase
MHDGERIYLDHAATGWPKPPGVLEAMIEYQGRWGAAAGRSSTRAAAKSQRLLESVRDRLLQQIGGKPADRLALCSSGTHALRLAIESMLRPGDHVIASAAEHNSVLRPLVQREQRGEGSWSLWPVDDQGVVDPSRLSELLRPTTRMVILSHASNVTGALQPIAQVARELASRDLASRQAFLLVDASQTVGQLPIDVHKLGIDLLAATCYKALGGMPGTAFTFVSERCTDQLKVPWVGGTGSASHQLASRWDWTEAAESGVPNTAAWVSVDAALDWLNSHGIEPLRAIAQERTKRLLAAIRRIPSWHLVGHQGDHHHWLPLVSLKTDTMLPQEWAALLDSQFGIECRAGFHCAGAIHPFLGTDSCGGTLRFSLGHTTTDQCLTSLEEAIEALMTLGGNEER